jgi:predicted DNA-binding transcriptional regulator AlpA
MEWVRLQTYLSQTGESRSTWYRLRESGELLEDKHYRLDKSGRVWVNVRAMSSWLENKTAARRRRSAA